MTTIQIEGGEVSRLIMANGHVVEAKNMVRHITNDGRVTLSYTQAAPKWIDNKLDNKRTGEQSK